MCITHEYHIACYFKTFDTLHEKCCSRFVMKKVWFASLLVIMILSFKRAHKYGFTNRSLTVNELLNTSAADLYQKVKYPTHCLHMLLPPKKSIDYSLGNSDYHSGNLIFFNVH